MGIHETDCNTNELPSFFEIGINYIYIAKLVRTAQSIHYFAIRCDRYKTNDRQEMYFTFLKVP